MFNLHSDDETNLSGKRFSFSVDPFSKARFLLTRDASKLKITFNEYNDAAKELSALKNLLNEDVEPLKDLFKVEALYQTQTDRVEELLLKSQAYTSSYKALLRRRFEHLAINDKLFHRVIIGNYTEAKNVHSRPFSKFTRDLAIQFKLITDEQ